MTDQSPESGPSSQNEPPSRPIWLQGLVGLVLGVCVMGLLWYLFSTLL